jgi:hypothetical protein
MRTKKNIVFLIENGLSINTVSKMTDNQVKVLVEKFKKSEEKEAFEKVTIPSQTQLTGSLADLAQTGVDVKDGNVKYDQASGMVTVVTKEGEVSEDAAMDYATGYNPNEFGGNLPVNDNNPQDEGTPDPDGKNDGMAESEIKEKFQSKSQQGLFWARCNKCSDKKCKWCKMAKEFSDSTSKKDYKKMPEKKRPEKTNESSQKYWENKILEMLEEEKKRRKKTPKKESETMILRNPKKMTMFSNEAPMELPIAKMFSIGKK